MTDESLTIGKIKGMDLDLSVFFFFCNGRIYCRWIRWMVDK